MVGPNLGAVPDGFGVKGAAELGLSIRVRTVCCAKQIPTGDYQ